MHAAPRRVWKWLPARSGSSALVTSEQEMGKDASGEGCGGSQAQRPIEFVPP